MEVLRQIGLIFFFGLCGQVLEYALGANLPASVLALVLMLAALRLGVVKEGQLGQTAQFLSGNMAFFFLPSAVAIMGDFSVVQSVLGPVLVIILVTLLITFGVTYAVTAGVQALMEKRRRS